jgi:hypothetical protein
MAEETFNQLYSRYNTDDVFNRVVIIGLLDLLNNKLKYNQIWDNNVVEEVVVPFMYDFGTSDERFAQDNYAYFGTTCFNEKKITGKFDMCPRGAIKYTGSAIDSGNITNRFIKGNFLKNENGRLTSYTAFMYSIPLTFNFECEMWIDTMLTAFKIEQALREAFYKNKSYYVLYRGMKISCCAGFPESSTTEKTVSYSFDAERQIKMTFSLAVEAYQPVFDETTAIETSNRIERFAYDVELPSNRKENSGVLSSIKILDSYDGMIYPAETGIPIRWVSKSEVSDIVTIGISLVDNDTNEETLVDIIPFNTRNYVYNIPAEFGSFEQPIIVINDQDLVEDEPLIKIIPENDYILADSFIVVSEGSFKCVNGQLPITVEVVNEDGSITISDSYYLNIVNKKIDTNNPVELTGEPLKCKKDYKEKNISLKVFNPLDKSVYDKTANILII